MKGINEQSVGQQSRETHQYQGRLFLKNLGFEKIKTIVTVPSQFLRLISSLALRLEQF